MTKASLQRKLVMAIMQTTLVSLIVSSIAMVLYNLEKSRDNATTALNAQAALLARAVTPALQFNDPESAQSYLKLMQDEPKIISVAIYNARGVLFSSYSRGEVGAQSIPDLPEPDSIRTEQDSLVIFKRIVVNNEILGVVFVRTQYELWATLWGNFAIAFIVILLALTVAFFISLRLEKTITKPLLTISKLAQEFVETKNYSLRASHSPYRDIDYLVEAFNAMLDEVEEQNRSLENFNRELEEEVAERKEAQEALIKSEENVIKLNTELELRVEERTLQLEIANKELEAFSYSVSHDLRSPLRAIDGFSQALLEDYDSSLDDTGKDYLRRVRAGAQRMGLLIDDLLKLSRVSRSEMTFQEINLSEMAEQILRDLQESEPDRKVTFSITSGLNAVCDAHLIKVALNNLLGNAWKYTSRKNATHIEFGMRHYQGDPVFFIQDNGVGFNMDYAGKLFGAFQRLHTANDFPGTGIGLATVKRVISRHGGEIWAEAKQENGATFYFTLPSQQAITSTPESGGNDDEQSSNIAGRR